jgi:hypothetical protein
MIKSEMMIKISTSIFILFIAVACSAVSAQQLPRDQWGALPVRVSHNAGKWVIKGKHDQVTLTDASLALSIQAGPAQWNLMPSLAGDILVKSKGGDVSLRIADAKKIDIVPYDTGFKTGLKISASGWQQKGIAIDLDLFLTICLEGQSEELVFDVVANEREATLRQLDWPAALDARDVDYTLLPNGRGTSIAANMAKRVLPDSNDYSGRKDCGDRSQLVAEPCG